MFKKLKIHWTKNLFLLLGIALALILIDLLTKWLVQNLVPLGQPVEVIKNFFYINKSYNIAIAFSLGSQLGVGGRVINISISVIMSVIIFGYWLTHNHKMNGFEKTIAILLAAGAVGNLIDRAFYWEATTGFNGVIDFFQFYLGGGPNANVSFVNPFATFNFADACLTIGILLLIVYLIIDAIRNRDTSLSKDPRLSQKPQNIPQNAANSENEANSAAENIVSEDAQNIPENAEEKQ
ncbi:MAG: signal peptidase II [Bacilli bacterium]|nr:signal peptidase II [Bacilli bacterium]